MREVILLIDDSAAIHQLVRSHLERRFDVRSAYDGRNGLAAALEHKPDLILLDIDMPVIQGWAVCLQLKADRETRDIPVVFLSAAASIDGRVRGLDAGACDYIAKPFEPAELAARVRAALRTRRAIDDLARNTMVDDLTGLFDRRYFEAHLDTALAAARRTGRPVACVLVQVDRMGTVNGAFGRELGDEVLRAVGRGLLQASRREDVPCRFGGDAFAVVTSDAQTAALPVYADRLRSAVRSAVVCDDAERVIRVTASLGVSQSDAADAVPIVQAARAALARAVKAGGDCARFDRGTATARAATARMAATSKAAA